MDAVEPENDALTGTRTFAGGRFLPPNLSTHGEQAFTKAARNHQRKACGAFLTRSAFSGSNAMALSTGRAI
jgi:hypothetical protein